jgi:hypothetical protein
MDDPVQVPHVGLQSKRLKILNTSTRVRVSNVIVSCGARTGGSTKLSIFYRVASCAGRNCYIGAGQTGIMASYFI